MGDSTVGDAQQMLELGQEEYESGNLVTAAAALLMAAEGFAATGDDDGAAQALGSRGAALFHVREYQESAEAYGAASEAADRSGDLAQRARCLWLRTDALAALGRWPAVLQECGQAVTLMQEYGHEEYLPGALLLLGRAQYYLDDELGSLETLERARGACRDRGDVRGVVAVDDFALTVSLYLGRHEQALEIATRQLRTCRSLSDRLRESHARYRLGQAQLAAGLTGDAERSFDTARIAYRDAGRAADAAVCVIGLSRAVASRDLQTAVELLRDAAETLEAAGPDMEDKRVEALEALANLLYDLEEFAESIDVDRRLIGALSAGQRETYRCRAVGALVRCLSAMIHEGEHEAAESLLGDVRERMSGCGHAGCAFNLCAASCWVLWNTDGQPMAVDQALDLIGDLRGDGSLLAQAWVLEIAGTATADGQHEGIAYLGRALAIYTELIENLRAVEVARLLLQRTTGLTRPAQGWLPIGGTENE